MPKKTILFSWIGHADLKAMALHSNELVKSTIEKEIGPFKDFPKDGLGPVKVLLSNVDFSAVTLLSNYSDDANNTFKKWLNQKNVCIEKVPLDNPTEYSEVYTIVEQILRKTLEQYDVKNTSICFLLSPGTPAMAAIWILLGKTKYAAQFYQTYNNTYSIAEIPFDITVDVIPEILLNTDNYLQRFASKSPQEIQGFEDIIGSSQSIKIAVGRAQKAAIRNVPILITGESGTGKELFARAIHAASSRKTKDFIAINCAAIPKDLLESELFGHVKGAFTGAHENKKGAFEKADGGILFLDEIGECDPLIQAKLLRVLQPLKNEPTSVREILPVGSSKTIKVDVRIVAATNRNLLTMVERGLFREDLYYRLAVIIIGLPPLRDRKNDIPDIASSLLNQINSDFSLQEIGFKHKFFSDSTKKFVKQCAWRGNVRQLFNVLLQAVVMADSEEITVDDIQNALDNTVDSTRIASSDSFELNQGFSLDKHLELIEKEYIQKAISTSDGVKSDAAKLLGIKNYQTLDAKLKKYKITVKN